MNRAQVYIAGPEEAIRIGQDGSCHVRTDFPCDLLLAGGTLYIASGEVYINDRPVPRAAGKAGGGAAAGKLEAGDFFRTGTLTVTMKDGGIACSGTGFSVCLPQAPPPTGAMDMGDFPEYKRPPRIIKNIEAKTVEVKPPKAKEKPKKGQILKTVLPPLIMAALMTSSRVMGGGNLITMFMGAGMAVAAVFSITSFFSDKKDRKEAERKRKKSYGEYLLMKRKELHAVRAAEEEARTYAYPELPEIERLTKGLSGRIYERTPHDGDFLSVSLGRAGAVPAFKVTFNDDEFAGDEDELLKEARGVVKGFRTLPDMPLTASLRGAHLGLVGEKGLARDALHSLIAQICFLHSYHDVEIVMAIDAEDREYFEWATWYPHFKISAINLSGLITSENHRDMALGALTQIFKDRKMKRDEHKKESLYLPHFVVIVLSPGMVVNHSVMEYLKEADTSLGFSLIWASPMTESLPENIGTILSLDGKERGKLLMNEGRFAMTPVKLPETDGIGFERMSRRLTAIRHNQGVTTQIPEAVTFFEMMGIKKPEELNVLSLWRESNSAKSLAVPLGFRGPKDTVYLNLHEKAHGPHGLVAGTTGSGKSEILQSYIISLALHFHPYEVGFLLIDYKGGGMANLFAGLPHLLGTITNLDGSESMRALASIKSELARRQRIFTDVGVNNISAYAKAFRKGEAVIPLPHLFIISDEFAELKKEQPDFMAELISAARIGRSLGVHLILATQKPSGVVNDQIWSNSKFKLCLKVQDSSDSNEILKTPDAAMITIPGRSYLQVGNNEIYELFQSAWSGAEFSEQEVKQGFDERIYLVNELGQGELLNKDLSAETEVIESKLTQLDVVVQHISAVWDSLPSKPVDKPWLPPLPQKIVSPAVKIPECPPDGMDLSAPVGLVDIPEEQKQMEYVHDFSKDGNFAVFGASGFGKSICLMNMVLTLSARNTPDDLHFYIMDLGNSALIQLKNLPHTADYITYEPMEKISKFVRIMEEQISRRKSLFAKESAINFKMYRQVAKEKLPAIFVVVDGFDVVKEIPLELAEFFLKLTRDGTGIGIYSIFSVTQISTIRYAILNNFKAKIGLYLFDKSEYTNIVGRPNYTLPDVKGRAFIKLASPCIMQCYLPAPYEDDVSFTGQAGAFVSGLARLYPGTYAPRIPMLPDAVTMRDIEREESVPWYMAPVGLDAEHVTRQYIDSRESKHLIIGKPRTGRSNMLKVFLSGVFGRK
ncbi:MAG: type VII secretion protein EssC, partial [Clostridiales bacterium]|nr:type VII secretion protein EssC [Clostridiales bacterium]